MSAAAAALATLTRQYVAIPDNGMFNSHDYVFVCHGCGVFHAVRASFISSPLSLQFDFSDGSSMTVPAHSCGRHHGDNAIREAWERGVKRAVFNSAAAAVGAEPWPEPMPCSLCGAADHPGNLQDGAHALCHARKRSGLPCPPLESRYR